MNAYVRDLVDRIKSMRRALGEFTPEQQAGRSSLALRLAQEIETLECEARKLLYCLREDRQDLDKLIEALEEVRSWS